MIKTKYRGIEIEYVIARDKWHASDPKTGVNAMSAKLSGVKAIMDKKLDAEEKKPFKRFDAWSDGGWGRTILPCTVTSYVELDVFWIVYKVKSGKGERTKCNADSIYKDTAANRDKLTKAAAYEGQATFLSDKAYKLKEQLVHIDIPAFDD